MTVRHQSTGLVVVIIFGCLLRLISALVAPNDYAGGLTFPDSHNYASIASNVVTKLEYSNTYVVPGCYECLGAIGTTSFREPVYPLYLAIHFKFFGESPRAVFISQALLATLTIPLCFAAASMFLSSRAALLGAFIESMNPYHIRYSSIVATETISSVILLSMVFFALRAFRAMDAGRPISRLDIAMLVVSLSAGILTHSVLGSVALVTLVFVGVARYRKSASLSSALRTVGLLVLLTVACVSPWFIRNYVIWHTLVYHTASGQMLVEGFNDSANGALGEVYLELDRALAPYKYDEVERDRIFRDQALDWIRSHPGRAILLSGVKQLRFWSPIPATVSGYQKLVGVVWASTLLILSAVGLVGVRKSLLAFQYLATVIVAYALLHSLAIAVTRYRLPLEGVLAIFAGCGLDRVVSTLRSLIKRGPLIHNQVPPATSA